MTFSDFINQGIIGYYLSTPTDNLALFATLYFGGFILCIVAGYLCGSVNTAILVSKKLYGGDVRDSGSKNAGMTNMLRTYGGNAAKLTLLGDIAKTVVAYLIGTAALGIRGAYFACFMCVLGHVFPIFHRFRGGKGMVCAATMILLLNPLAFAILIVVFAIVAIGLKYVSLASIMVAMLYPLAHSWTIGYMPARLWPTSSVFAVATALLILWRHYPNMKRLWDRTESKTDILAMIRSKKSKKQEDGNAK